MWSIFPCALIILCLMSTIYLLKLGAVWNSFLTFPRTFPERCHFQPVWRVTIKGPTAPAYGFPGGSVVKNAPAMQETRVQSLGQEDPLEQEVATHSRILAWEIPWTEEPDGLQTMGSQTTGYNWVTTEAPVLRCVYDPNQLIPPAPHLSLLAAVTFFPKSVYLFLFCDEVHLNPFFDSTRRDILWYPAFPVSPTSLSMIISGFFPVTGSGIDSSLYMSE